jgi:hypothetical protein
MDLLMDLLVAAGLSFNFVELPEFKSLMDWSFKRKHSVTLLGGINRHNMKEHLIEEAKVEEEINRILEENKELPSDSEDDISQPLTGSVPCPSFMDSFCNAQLRPSKHVVAPKKPLVADFIQRAQTEVDNYLNDHRFPPLPMSSLTNGKRSYNSPYIWWLRNQAEFIYKIIN